MSPRKQAVIDAQAFQQLKAGRLRAEVVGCALSRADEHLQRRDAPFVLTLLQFPQVPCGEEIPRNGAVRVAADPDVDRRRFAPRLIFCDVEPERTERMRTAQAGVDAADEKLNARCSGPDEKGGAEIQLRVGPENARQPFPVRPVDRS